MSYNTNPERAAKRHPGPIIAIVAALLVAAAAGVWWMGADPAEHGDVGRVESTVAPDAAASGTAPQPAAPASN